ncbi:ribosome hibernation-promoting factor, HPF/YfiA family [Geotalea uraniireducens]|uniref:Ribosome hibernation promoting factor n=1 Tax=Geotalea uraniireducens (strain Rf4) TaxID=351605 RepID=A5G5S5_GEOUR|nr:ribosome-associated translation inhibitor RaiA [Geotalea uraniireducens]ABQ27143.1 SSU ribosomal protein S30P [Geotalea uraniireducens Rf4]
MQITTTFRHMEPSDPLKSYAEEKLERVKKYIDEPIVAQVFLTVEKIRHSAEVTITAKGITMKASEETNDMYAAVDAVVDKIERQLRRYKERIKAHKPATDTRERLVQKSIVEAESIEQQREPVIIRTKTFSLKPMSVEEAVMQMDLLHKDFLVYTEAATENINVIYRRKDGNYGLIEPNKE